MICTLGERRLETADLDYYIAPGAQVIGSVKLGHGASVWFNCVLRADEEPITVGDASNVQDGTIVHMDAGSPVVIGANVTIGHRALLHGCTIGEGSMVASGAIVLDGARVGRNCLIAAGTLVAPDTDVPDDAVMMGVPGKVMRRVRDADLAMMRRAIDDYLTRARYYRSTLAVQSR